MVNCLLVGCVVVLSGCKVCSKWYLVGILLCVVVCFWCECVPRWEGGGCWFYWALTAQGICGQVLELLRSTDEDKYLK
ncbi:hypothetical protein DFH27DRAFT_558168 [Peziza echinospora]|nr:hypothetical protein DFH27DRAFT_558168 [Peziza echinospora]